jgi:hypothetical protein
MLADTLLLMVTEAPIASPVVALSFIILKPLKEAVVMQNLQQQVETAL